MTSPAQKEVLHRQMQRVVQAQTVLNQEKDRLRDLMVMLDSRFAAAKPGVRLDPDTLEVVEDVKAAGSPGTGSQ